MALLHHVAHGYVRQLSLESFREELRGATEWSLARAAKNRLREAVRYWREAGEGGHEQIAFSIAYNIYIAYGIWYMLTFNPPTGSLCLQVAVGSVSVLRTLTKWHVDGRRLVSIDQAAASLENKAEDPPDSRGLQQKKRAAKPTRCCALRAPRRVQATARGGAAMRPVTS